MTQEKKGENGINIIRKRVISLSQVGTVLSKVQGGVRARRKARRSAALRPAATAKRAPHSALKNWVRISNSSAKENQNPT